MKKLLLLIIPVGFLFACNAEMSAEQFRAQSVKQCKKQYAKMYLEDDATDEETAEFCDCYADYLVGDAEVITVKEVMNKSTKVEALTTALEECAENVQAEEVVEEIIETPEEVEVVE